LTITIAPQVLIEGTLFPEEDVLWTAEGSQPILVNTSHWDRLRDTAGGRARLFAALHAKEVGVPHLVTTHQALTRWADDDADFFKCFPLDLSDTFWFIDEAHHVSEDNCLGKVIKKIDEHGGWRCCISATMFRDLGGDILIDPDTAPIYILSMADAMAEPDESRFCPKKVSFRHFRCPGDKDLFEYWSDRLEEDEWPKALCTLKQGDAPRRAAEFIRVLKKRNPKIRILNAVGIKDDEGESVKDKVGAALKAERDLLHYDQSQYDIIVSCHRFKEGADWPLCSHVYVERSLSSETRGPLLQQLGRGLRDKRWLAGYPEKYKDHTLFSLVWTDAPKTSAEWTLAALDRTFMTAAFMADCQVATDFLRDPFRNIVDERARSGKDNPQDWVEVRNALGLAIEESKQSLGYIAQAQVRLDGQGYDKKEWTKARMLREFHKMKLDAVELGRAQLALELYMAKNLKHVATACVNRVRRKLQGYVEGTHNFRWIRAAFYSAFAEVVEDHQDCIVPDLITGVQQAVAEITGLTAESVRKALTERNSWECMCSRVRGFHKANGHANFDRSRPEERDLAEWCDRQRNLHRNNLLSEEHQAILAEIDVPLIISTDDIVSELIRWCKADPEWIPTSTRDLNGLGTLAKTLRINGTDARRAKVIQEVPWFDLDNDVAELRRLLHDGKETILLEETPDSREYENYHLAFRLGYLPAKFQPVILSYAAVDLAYQEVYAKVWATRKSLIHGTSTGREISRVLEGPPSRSRPSWMLTFAQRIQQDRLLDFERRDLFSEPAFKPLLVRYTDDKAHMEQCLHGVTRENNIKHQSLVGFWWTTLTEADRDTFRVRRFTTL